MLKFGTMLSYDCHRPSRVASLVAGFPIPCLLSFSLCPVAGSLAGESCPASAWSLVNPVPLIFRDSGKEISGSHKFPSYPFGSMPRSHQTPVESWPLALPQPGLLPSAACKASALASCLTAQEVILLSTTILISGLNNAACFLTTSRLRTSIAGLVRGFVSDLLARLWSGGT